MTSVPVELNFLRGQGPVKKENLEINHAKHRRTRIS